MCGIIKYNNLNDLGMLFAKGEEAHNFARLVLGFYLT
jgi:hypothetical protein